MIKKSHIIKSKHFNISRLNDYDLKIKCLSHQIRVSLIDDVKKYCIYYEVFNLKDIKKDDRLNSFHTFWDEHPFLKAQSWKTIKIIIAQAPVTYIPQIYNNRVHYSDFLKLNGFFGIDKDRIFSFKHQHFDLVSLVALDAKEKDFFIQKAYNVAKVEFLHVSTAFIELLFHFPQRDIEIYLNVSENVLTVVAFINEKLTFINNYVYKDSNDIIYFGNLIIQHLDMKPKDVNITLWGDVDHTEKEKLGKYLPNFSFGTRYPHVGFEAEFNALENYLDFDLLG